ncbi:MAG: cytochrome c biogenesis protein ResB [Oscillospiraceae bacterium]|nr:cytochrome c biogenesis protein ResB [Oscillospiraceae bacterium]MBQ9664664.1 cytochrome c biogenesis protein ResB [Oscillospiraceae bacterium]
MKTVYNFIRSMRFGLLLMALIGALCVIATTTGRDDIYSSWYFILLFVILGLNLTLCSVVRVMKLGGLKSALMKKAANSEAVIAPDDPEQWLKAHRFRSTESGYIKHGIGFYGSFLTHVSILLMMISAACIFALAEKEDLPLCVGDTAELSDGTLLTVEAFSTEDENGVLEYTSELSAQLTDGSEAGGIVQVNHPIHLGKFKIYQQNYAYAAVLGIRTDLGAEEEALKLDEPAFLSLDGENGIWYSQMFGNVVEENGEIRVSHDTEIVNPAYEVSVIENGSEQPGLIYPGTTLEVAGVYYSFYPPEAYPGLMVKTQPEGALCVLYLSFVLLTLGLYLCFFQVPEAAQIKADGIALAGRKDISQQIDHYRAELNS